MNNKDKLLFLIEEAEKNLEKLKRQLLEENYDDFEIWHKYETNKNTYNYLLGVGSPLRKYLDTHFSWVYQCRYMKIDLEWVLESMEILLDDGEITRTEIEEMKLYLLSINFGELTINW